MSEARLCIGVQAGTPGEAPGVGRSAATAAVPATNEQWPRLIPGPFSIAVSAVIERRDSERVAVAVAWGT